MPTIRPLHRNSSFAALRRLVPERAAAERCELCGATVAAEHGHLVAPAERRLVCACEPCSILFSGTDGKYRRVPRRIRLLRGFQMTDAQWDALDIPIDMAFFFVSSVSDRVVACYPSPAGPTESLLPLGAWDEIVRENPTLAAIEPDVEALLVNRVSSADCFLVPIDECYRLTGLIRSHWRGLSGGSEAWAEIGRFFASLEERATGEVRRA